MTCPECAALRAALEKEKAARVRAEGALRSIAAFDPGDDPGAWFSEISLLREMASAALAAQPEPKPEQPKPLPEASVEQMARVAGTFSPIPKAGGEQPKPDAGPCAACGGRGYTDCDDPRCSDSTWDHYCNAGAKCRACGTGREPEPDSTPEERRAEEARRRAKRERDEPEQGGGRDRG